MPSQTLPSAHPSMPPPAPPPTSPVPHNAPTIDVDADGLPLPPTELLSQPVITPPSPTTTASTPFMQRWWQVAVGLLALIFPLPGALFSNPAPLRTGGGGPLRPPAPPPEGLSDNLALLAIASLLLLTIIGIEHFRQTALHTRRPLHHCRTQLGTLRRSPHPGHQLSLRLSLHRLRNYHTPHTLVCH